MADRRLDADLQPGDPVPDDELLYRCVEDKPGYWKIEDGRVVPSTSAFFDPMKCPSVDQASRRGYEPRFTRRSPNDGVAVLLTSEVRAIAEVYKEDPKTRNRTAYSIDVLHQPIAGHPTLPDNPAHAEITPAPAIQSNGVFQRMRVALVRLARQRPWAIVPPAALAALVKPAHE
jgi:hypothetical protein